MIDLKQLQKRIFDNKVRQGFNTTNVHQEFCYLHEEASEACHAYNQKLPDLGEELADTAIYLLGLAEMLDINLEQEILNKMNKNEHREYRKIDGVITRVRDF